MLKLLPPGPAVGLPMNEPQPEIGVIGGSRNNLPFGSLIADESDGRVPRASLAFPGMSECIVLPYHHHEIHHVPEVAELVGRFLATGSFVCS